MCCATTVLRIWSLPRNQSTHTGKTPVTADHQTYINSTDSCAAHQWHSAALMHADAKIPQQARSQHLLVPLLLLHRVCHTRAAQHATSGSQHAVLPGRRAWSVCRLVSTEASAIRWSLLISQFSSASRRRPGTARASATMPSPVTCRPTPPPLGRSNGCSAARVARDLSTNIVAQAGATAHVRCENVPVPVQSMLKTTLHISSPRPAPFQRSLAGPHRLPFSDQQSSTTRNA